jgi:pre-mRNA-splicing factor SPF27
MSHLTQLVKDESSSERETVLHPLVDASYEPSFSSLIAAEHDRLESGSPKEAGSGIDLTRYEADALEPPNRTSPHSDEHNPKLLAQWRDTIQKAYTSSTYLSGRNTNLGLLETYGKNSWLISNWHQEGTLKGLERDLAEVKSRLDALNAERTRTQDEGGAEAQLLEETWKKGVRGIVEVQVAREGLRSEILEARRKGAV